MGKNTSLYMCENFFTVVFIVVNNMMIGFLL